MPTFFKRRYMRGRPGRREKVVGVVVLCITGVLVGLFALTGGLFAETVESVGPLRAMKNYIGLSEESPFRARHSYSSTPSHERLVAEALLPATVGDWQRETTGLESAGAADQDWGGAIHRFAAEYINNEQKITVELAELADPQAAAELFDQRRPSGAEDARFGRQGWQASDERAAGFWSGRYYMELNSDAVSVTEAVRGLASRQLAYGGPFGGQGEGTPIMGEENRGTVEPAAGKARFAEVDDPAIMAPTEIERYAENLYEKINGKEGMFREFNVVDLRFGQYVNVRTQETFDVYVYDMARPVNAMGIFMKEFPPSPPKVDIGRKGYRSGYSIYFWKGPYYVNVLAPTEGNDQTQAAATRVAEAIAVTIADEGKSFWAEDLLAADEQVADSFRYIATGGLGFEFIKRLFLAEYKTGEMEYELFLHRSESAGEAAKLFEQFVEETQKYDTILSNEKSENGAIVAADVLGIYTVAFYEGSVFGGATECEDLELARKKAGELLERVKAARAGE